MRMRLGLKAEAWMVVACVAAGCSDDGLSGAGGAETASNTDGAGTGSGNGLSSGGMNPTDPTQGDTDDPDATGSTSPTGDGDDSTGAGDTDVEPGTLPEPVEQSGVAYVAHFLDNDLRWYRTDGDTPTAGGTIDLGDVTHDMTLDPVNDRLFIAQDVARRVLVYSLSRPDSPADPVADPVELSSITFETPPRFVQADPYHGRIYVVTDHTVSGNGLMLLHTLNVADPENPTVVNEMEIPATTSFDVDGPRQLLVLFHGITDEVFAYDVSGEMPAEVAGSPIDLREAYPEENNTAFSARNLTLDPWHARMYAARPQSAFSELIVMEYPIEIPGEGQAYDEVTTFALDAIEDPFDLSVDIADRPGILDAFTPLPSPLDTLVFMTASAWNGTLPSATLVGFTGENPLMLDPGCEDHEGFGCFVRDYVDGSPISFLQTDGAACRDWTHGVIVTTALASPEDEPGHVAFFQYADGSTAPWLSAEGENVAAATFPIGAVCH